MGRKSAKGKEKKLRRKEEQACLAASKAIVDAANKLEDPMARLAPFKKYNRNGLDLTIDCQRSTSLGEQTLEWAFNVTKKNMQPMYERSRGGWRPQEKKDEMTDERTWYLIAWETDNTPVGLISFRFDMDFDDEVVYCYEIQLIEEVRGKGLGRFLMQILSLLAHQNRMKKVMLTVFKHNDSALKFFKEILNFEIDVTSPSIFDPLNEDQYDYEIMSKSVRQKTAKPAGDCKDGCTHSGH